MDNLIVLINFLLSDAFGNLTAKVFFLFVTFFEIKLFFLVLKYMK